MHTVGMNSRYRAEPFDMTQDWMPVAIQYPDSLFLIPPLGNCAVCPLND